MTLAADQMVDSPTNNFATLNSIAGGTNSAFSEGNLKNVGTVSSFSKAYCTIPITSGKWYTELCGVNVANNAIQVGITSVNPIRSNSNQNGEESGTSFYGLYNSGRSGGYIFNDASATNSLTRANDDDIIGIAFDADAGNVKYYINNTLVGSASGYSPTNVSGTFWFCLITRDVGSSVINFGQDSSFAGAVTAQGNQDSNGIGDFYYEPPTDFLALCTSNLPDVAVTPSEHFNTVLYTGDGSGSGSQAITGVGFQPDLVWLKSRSQNWSHSLINAISGASVRLRSQSTGIEQDITGQFAFGADGFTVTDGGNSLNNSPNTYVAWNWKANGSGSANNAGDLDATVSANTDAGFSIVKYVGNNVDGATVAHGLSKAPEMIILKTLETVKEWAVGHDGMTWDSYQILSGSMAMQTSDYAFDQVAPTSTLFSVGAEDFNYDTEDHIAYCFHSVDGFSKVGTYEGNNSTDGTFVYTGFRPAYVLIKRSNGADQWHIHDIARSTYNPMDECLHTETLLAETTAYNALDFLSNGFKCRSTNSGTNHDGSPHVYMAFAETPFKYSNAR
jgi:hypothetical protein